MPAAKRILGFRVYPPRDTGSGYGYRNLTIRIGWFEQRDAGVELAAAIGRSDFQYRADKAQRIAEATGGPKYLDKGFDSEFLELTWQDDDGRTLGGGSPGPGRNHWYGIRAEMRPTLEAIDIVRKLIRTAGGDGVESLREQRPRDIVAALATLKASPVKYQQLPGDISSVWMIDSRFDVEKEIPLPAAADAVAA